MDHRSTTRALVLLAAAGGVVALVIALSGSLLAAGVAGLVTTGAAWLVARDRIGASPDGPADPARRRLLGSVALGGVAWVVGGSLLGRAIRRIGAPDPEPTLDAVARDVGAEYLELVERTYHPGRSGDLQLLLAPFNSSNYANESLSLVPRDPRTSHAAVWMYLERMPILVHAPGIVEPADSIERVTLADLAPTTAALMGFEELPTRDGRVLPGITPPAAPPKVIVTFVIDGGGWNVLRHWHHEIPDRDGWPNIKRLARQGAMYRNAIVGSFPAVTACAHANIGTGAFPRSHGISGHNVRTPGGVVKAYGTPGQADPGFILIPTLADLWSDATGDAAWVGQIGYQVWHMGMIGYGGRNRAAGAKPVGVFWDEYGSRWQPHNPDLFRLPNHVPGPETLARHQSEYTPPGWDSQFDPGGRQEVCCSPPIIRYQGDLIQAAFDSEPIGSDDVTDLLYINYKSPDYTGHIYNMYSKMEWQALREVDAQLGRLADMLANRFRPGEYVLIVTADHGQCPLPDAVNGTRVDPIQLRDDIERELGRGVFPIVESVVPSEVYLDPRGLVDAGVTSDDVAAFLADYRYRDNIGPYVPRSAVEQSLLDQREFAAVLPTTWIQDTLRGSDISRFGPTRYTDADDGVPPVLW